MKVKQMKVKQMKATIPSGYSEWLRLQLQKREPEQLCPFGTIECHVAYMMRYCWPCREARAAYQRKQKEEMANNV